MEPIKPVKPIKRAPVSGDWVGTHRRTVRAAAVVAGVVGVLMNIIHEGGHRNVISMVIGTALLLFAVLAWNAPKRVPRPPKYPDRFDKRT
jgi:hypothetical protein